MNLKDVDLRYVYRKWKSNLEFFEPFMRSGPFVSLQNYEDFEIGYSPKEEELYEKYKIVIDKILHEDLRSTFVIVDLELMEDLEIAYVLNNRFSIKPVLNCNFLFHPYGLIGGKSEIEALVTIGQKLQDIIPKGYVFFLDYGRYKDFSLEVYKKKLNNQYELTEEDVPNLETLKELGFARIVIITKDTLKEDVNYYANYLKQELQVEVLQGV